MPDYKSTVGTVEPIDLIPSWAFWREGCYLFAKNVLTVLELAGVDDRSTIVSFIRSLPYSRGAVSTPTWQADVCSQCLKKALDKTPDAEKRGFQYSVLDYFVYHFLDRDRTTQFMLVEAFLGFMTAIIDEAEKGPKEAPNGQFEITTRCRPDGH